MLTTTRSTLALGGLAALLAALASCSYVYDVHFDVTLTPDVASRAGVVMLVVEGDSGTDQQPLPHTPGTTSYQGTISVCCSPKPTVEIRAFLDEDGDGQHDEGEAQAEHAGNPVTLDGELTVALTLASS